MALVTALPVSGEVAPPEEGPQVFPSPITTGSWRDLAGCSWRRRGKEQSAVRLRKLVLDPEVPVVVLYAFEVHAVPDDLRAATAAMLKAHWRRPDLESVDGAEFTNEDGSRSVILEVSC